MFGKDVIMCVFFFATKRWTLYPRIFVAPDQSEFVSPSTLVGRQPQQFLRSPAHEFVCGLANTRWPFSLHTYVGSLTRLQENVISLGSTDRRLVAVHIELFSTWIQPYAG